MPKGGSTRWKPGQSGNPKGRPRGSGEVARLRAAVAEALPDILQTLIDRAAAGDVQAARVLLDRALPPLKPTELPAPVALPDGATLTEQGRAVLGELASGRLAPGQAAALLGAIAALARVAELDELARRVEALEGRTINGEGDSGHEHAESEG